MTETHFYTDERTFWHSTGVQALNIPIGGWVEPPTGSFGADTPGAKRRILNLIRASGLDQYIDIRSAPAAMRGDLLKIHPPKYLNEFERLSREAGGELGVYAPFSKGGFEIATLSAGLAIAAVDAVLNGEAKNAYALCRPAGHHCLADQSMGFCLLANIPIAIEVAKNRHSVDRVAVLDWDVHQGNGTQKIFYDRSDVLTVSIHQENNFPGNYTGEHDRGIDDGEGFNLNVPMPTGSGHEAYIYAMKRVIIPMLERYDPDIIIVASGLDGNIVDPLGKQLLVSESFRLMTRMVMTAADQLCSGRLAMVHEGGYSEAYVPFCGQAICEELSGSGVLVVDPQIDHYLAKQPGARSLQFQRQWVDDLADHFGLT
ncbi:MAG: class II histone deacetylase [Pseudomonadota bacterium]